MPARRPSSPSVPSRPGFDLGRDYGLVCRIFWDARPGLARRCRGAGLDPEDVFQRVCLSLLIRQQGTHPYDPARGRLAPWLRHVARGVVGHAIVAAGRQQARETLTEDAGADVGEWPEMEGVIDVDRRQVEEATREPLPAERAA